LKKFADEYQGPNQSHFGDLLTAIDWNKIEEKTNRRLRAFGKFLQTISLPDPLTWESIQGAMPVIVTDNKVNLIHIRSCLLELAHLRVEQGLLEKREVYLARRIVMHLAAQAPECFQQSVRMYVNWLERLKNSPSTMRYFLVSLNPFFAWCVAHEIQCPSKVSAHIFEEYEQFLSWKWVCEHCHRTLPFDVYAETPMCQSCAADDSMRKTRRYAHATIEKDCGALRNFFQWAEISGLGPNPISTPVRHDYTFRHYSDDVIKGLVEYIFSPSAEPVEALVLYLIIFHAFSMWELIHVLLPSAETNDSQVQELAQAYCVLLPAAEPSRSNLSPGRPELRVEFPASAATLLKPLLERYERWRLESLVNPNNKFLLVAPGRARHDNPVCREFVRRVVKRGSSRAGVGECNPKRLRATAAILYADSGVTGLLTWLGWSASHGFKFTWNERREVVYPRTK
jgi:integrase